MISSKVSFLFKGEVHVLYYILGLSAFVCLLAVTHGYWSTKLESYVSRTTQETWGARSLAPEHEEKIKLIAQELGISQPIIIRRMSHTALRLYGYHNAFAYFPLLLTCIPIGKQSYLFVSEGFFEDLTPEEQRFIIGHEMIHIREQHARYLHLVLYALAIFLLIISRFLINRFKAWVQSKPVKYQQPGIWIIGSILFVVCFSAIELIEAAYRRHIEKVADHESLRMLQTYDGGIKLMERWQKELKLQEKESFYGLFADHPSCAERKTYCLELQNKLKDMR